MITTDNSLLHKNLWRVLLATVFASLSCGCASQPRTLGQTAWDGRIGVITVSAAGTSLGGSEASIRDMLIAQLAARQLHDPASPSSLKVTIGAFPSQEALSSQQTGAFILFDATPVVESNGQSFVFQANSTVYGRAKDKTEDERHAASWRINRMLQLVVASLSIERQQLTQRK